MIHGQFIPLLIHDFCRSLQHVAGVRRYVAYRFSIDHCCFFLFSESVDFCSIWQMLDSVACCLCTDQHFHFCFYPSLFPYSPSPLQQWWSHLTVDNPRCDCWPACIIPPMDIRFKEAEIQMQVSTDELLI